mmetsp:Transcript_2772/g.4981  ORF Transcript_2772/g.4981 Transcript_2772/m.4981 type:complete len:1459 (+) Transcript_2772:1728-6104(+)
MTLNCGGGNKVEDVVVLIMGLDADIVLLQELWSTDVGQQIGLYGYVIMQSEEVGRGRGMVTLVHRRLGLADKPTIVCDTRSWFAVKVNRQSHNSLLVVNVHVDPHLERSAKHRLFDTIGEVTKRLALTTVLGGDTNTYRQKETGHFPPVSKGRPLSVLRVPYPAGEGTNYTERAGRSVETEIDYVLVTEDLHLKEKSVLPGVSTHGVVMCDFEGVGGVQRVDSGKRYEMKAATPENLQLVSCVMGLFWHWLRFQGVHPDLWLRVYWFYADSVLPPKSVRAASRVVSRFLKSEPREEAPLIAEKWMEKMKDLTVARGLKTNREILASTSVSGLTTKAIKLDKSPPQPLPTLKSHPQQVLTSASDHIREAVSQLTRYHSPRGLFMDLTPLYWDSLVDAPIVVPDEPDVRTLLYALDHGEWHDDLLHRRAKMRCRPVWSYDTQESWERALHRGLSNTTAFDDLTFSLMKKMPYAGQVASREYVQSLRRHPNALSNHLLQMGIHKGGCPHVFETYRPIKVGSAPNRAEASCVHAETAYRAEMDGSLSGQVFAYRPEVRAQYMAFTSRAISSKHLLATGESHIVDGDESGAFDTPIRKDIATLSQLMDTQCSFGAWAEEFYGRQQIRLYTAHGIAQPVTTREGFSQGCSFAATGYGVIGTVRNRATLSYVMRQQMSILTDLAPPYVIPDHELVYSDDRRWFADSAPGITSLTRITHQVAGQACAINNLAKMAYTSLRLLGDGTIQRMGNTIVVAGAATRAGLAVPTVVGIPIQPNTYTPEFLAKVSKRCKKVRSFAKRYKPSLSLLIRCTYAYIVSAIDFVTSGALLPSQATQPLQTSLVSVFRVALALPGDTPLSAITLPVHMFGWGCPQVQVKSELSFLAGYLKAYDCRLATTRCLMRQQGAHPLPGLNDDASLAQEILVRHGLTVDGEHLPNFRGTLPELSQRLAEARVLAAVTDAGLEQTLKGDIRPKVGGLGIVFTDGVYEQLVVYRLRVAAADSTALEWLARLLAIWICRDYGGRLVVVCDNSSSFLEKFRNFVSVNPWCDRVAKLVLRQQVVSRLEECWVEAQHDSRSSTWIAQQQKKSDEMATWAQQAVTAPYFPFGSWTALLSDPALVLIASDAVVMKYNMFLGELYAESSLQRSVLSSVLSPAFYNKHVWEKVCMEQGNSLSVHKVAAHLRHSCISPRTLYDEPDCRFCGSPHSDAYFHHVRCPALFVRMAHALNVVVSELELILGAKVASSSDHWAILSTPAHDVVVIIATEQGAQQARQFTRTRCQPSQLILFSWSGLVHTQHKDNSVPGFVSQAQLAGLCGLVLNNMAAHHQFMTPAAHLRRLDRSRHMIWRPQGASFDPTHNMGSDMVLAWFLHVHGNAYIARPTATYFVQLPEFGQAADQFSCATYVCDNSVCFVCELTVHSAPTAVVCACQAEPDSVWSKFAQWGNVSLMVSKGFRAPYHPIANGRQ